MGKKTRIHPVSLNVIRGAAEFGGFKLGKLRQVEYDAEFNVAYYTTTIDAIPEDCKENPTEICGRLNGMFSTDLLCTSVSLKSGGNRTAKIMAGNVEYVEQPKPISSEEAIASGLVRAEDIPF